MHGIWNIDTEMNSSRGRIALSRACLLFATMKKKMCVTYEMIWINCIAREKLVAYFKKQQEDGYCFVVQMH